MKDKFGHGSEAHKEFHKPQVEHGNYEKGTEFHAIKRFDELRANKMGYRKAHKQVKEETGINLHKVDFGPYREQER